MTNPDPNQPKTNFTNLDKNPINKAGYPILQNKPLSCPACGNLTRGTVQTQHNPKLNESFRMISWRCSRCGNFFKRGASA